MGSTVRCSDASLAHWEQNANLFCKQKDEEPDSQNSRESETEDSPKETRGKRNKRKHTRTLFIARISQTVMKATMMTMEWHTCKVILQLMKCKLKL